MKQKHKTKKEKDMQYEANLSNEERSKLDKEALKGIKSPKLKKELCIHPNSKTWIFPKTKEQYEKRLEDMKGKAS